MFPLRSLLNVKQLSKDKMVYGTANIFGLIAYSARNPYMVKLLDDEVFWNSLNVRSEGWIQN